MATALAPSAPTAERTRPAYRPATFADAARAEWTKLRTVRSTYWCLLVAVVLGVGLGVLVSAISASHYSTDPGVHQGWNPTDRSIQSLAIAQLAFAILGVLVVTGEYSTGLIRVSLAVVPKRSRLLGAKVVVFTAMTLVAGEVIGFAAFLIGQAVMSGEAPTANLGTHEALRVVIGAGVYLALLSLLGLALGVLLRNAAAAIGSIVALLLVLPGIANALPSSWSNPIEKFWPTNAGQQIAMITRDSHTLAPWSGLALFAVFVAVVLVGAFVVLERRDA